MKIKSGAGFAIVESRQMIFEGGHFKSSRVKLTYGAWVSSLDNWVTVNRYRQLAVIFLSMKLIL